MSSETHSGAQFRVMDCNCRIGTFEKVEPPYFTDLAGLLTEMDYLGIQQALVMHSWASSWAPRLGNEKIDELLAGHENLYPCYVGLPGATDELPPPAEFAAHVREQHGAVRLFPVNHQWDFTQWGAGDLLEALDARAVPVLIDMQQTNWNQIAEVLARYQQLPVIVLGTSYRITRHIYPLFAKHANLYLESNTFQITWGIEDVCERFGADRLIFGTGLPENEGGGALAQITYNGLTDADTARIAGDNLRSLLGI
jgi:hypothetical protein